MREILSYNTWRMSNFLLKKAKNNHFFTEFKKFASLIRWVEVNVWLLCKNILKGSVKLWAKNTQRNFANRNAKPHCFRLIRKQYWISRFDMLTECSKNIQTLLMYFLFDYEVRNNLTSLKSLRKSQFPQMTWLDIRI